MASTGFLFNSALRDEAQGDIQYDVDTFYVMLLTNAAAPNKNTWTRRSSVTNEVAAGNGYTAGGQAVSVSVGAVDTVNNRVEITLGAAEWPASTITARYAVYYKHRGGSDTADELVAVVDFGQDVSTIADTFSLTASTIRKSNP